MIRDGRKYSLLTDNLVVGDVVEVRFGDRIPADLRVLKSSGFKVTWAHLVKSSLHLLTYLYDIVSAERGLHTSLGSTATSTP